DLMAAFTAFSPVYIALAALLTVIFLVVRGMASRTLLENKVTFRQAFLTINVGYLLNNIFPLRAGELGRAVLLGQSSGLGPMHVLSTIVIERAFDLAIAAGMLLSTLPLALGMTWARPVAVLTLLLVIAMLAALFMMARYQSKVHDWAGWLGRRIPLVERLVIPQLDALLRGLSVLVKPRMFLLSFGWIALSWVVAVAEYYVMIYALNPRAPLWWGAFVDSVLALGIAVPSAPGALGVFEAAMVGALSLLGFSASIGLAYAVILHFTQWVITAIFGIYGLMREGRSLSSFVSDITARVLTRSAPNETLK
ncbi:MAG TPA: lysylphosphatidylglycerol synthase transmembrane domain-containing protein, partial [Anaerolineaceae bacterium]|nr:lysylphosphatidylglycerol synthase transmembrane domain-containing protein [Anaerolineaceae bacterium]